MNNDITRYAGRYLSLLERDGWEFASRSNASGVVVLVPVTGQGEIVLVEQFRNPSAKTSSNCRLDWWAITKIRMSPS